MTSPWRTTAEIAEYLRLLRPDGTPDMAAAVHFLDANDVPTRRVGRSIRAHIDDVNAAMTVRTAGKHATVRQLRRAAV